MPMKLTFLDWNQPVLAQAASWLMQQDQPSQSDADFSAYTLVLPSARAGRRLLEMLVEQTAGRAMTPPVMTTLNKLPECLYQTELHLADELMTWLLRAEALKLTPAEEIKELLPHPPKEDDAIGQLMLAQEIQDIATELASHQHSFATVAQKITSLVEFDDHLRWETLARLDDLYHQLLTQRQMIDASIARDMAIADDPDIDTGVKLNHQGRVVLIATTELTPVMTTLLQKVQCPVDVLIHAPQDLEAGFDDAGRLVDSWWEDKPSDLQPRHIHMQGRPADQAYHIPRLISQLDPLPRPDQVTVGLGDQTMAAMVERTLAYTGIPSRNAAGRVIDQSPPAVLLQTIADLLGKLTASELAQALRCPAIEARVRQEIDQDGLNLLSHLDLYITNHLPHRLNDEFLDDEISELVPDKMTHAQVVRLAWDTLKKLLPAQWDQPRPLASWSTPIAQILQTFFGQRDLQRFDADDAILIRGIEAIAQALQQQSAVRDDLTVLAGFTLPMAIRLLLIQVKGQLLPPESGDPAVELLGWSELQLDDAPHLIITGFNEGNIPASTSNHWLMPDTLRQKLGLPDHRHRYVRDLYMLKAILHSRDSVDFIVGRTAEQGEPLTPSRLLLASAPELVPQWILDFYDDTPDSPRAPLMLAPGRVSQFDIPRPLPLAKPIEALSVTAFADYIACPYRFYLRHVLKLRALNDKAVEMDALMFGNMAHDVLQQFGQHKLSRSTDALEIHDYLASMVSQKIGLKYGSSPRAVIVIQQQILIERLSYLARWHAQQVSEGWLLDARFTERKLNAQMDVDGQPFMIYGRIDRCDHHVEGGYRLLDYKTGDTPKKVSQPYKKKQDKWVDLQLPLYKELVREHVASEPITLGYVQLPTSSHSSCLSEAKWTEAQLASAYETAAGVIRDIRLEKFWPPATNITTSEYAAICMDNCLSKPEYAEAAPTQPKTGGEQ